MSVSVKNLNGTGGKTPPSGYSWLSYWEAKMGKKANGCSNLSCSGKADVGGHVKKTSEGDHYLIPICYSCNNTSSSYVYEVNSSVLLKLN